MALSKILDAFHASAELDDRIFKTSIAVLVIYGGSTVRAALGSHD